MSTYSLMGWVFALFRIVASLITALAAGIMVNILGRKDPDQAAEALPNGNQEDSYGQAASRPLPAMWNMICSVPLPTRS